MQAITVSFRLLGFLEQKPKSLSLFRQRTELVGGATVCHYHDHHYDYYLLSAESAQLRSRARQLARQLAALAVGGGW